MIESAFMSGRWQQDIPDFKDGQWLLWALPGDREANRTTRYPLWVIANYPAARFWSAPITPPKDRR